MKAIVVDSRKKGVIGSIIVHAIMLLVILYFGFTAPYPPPPEQGILVNFGTDETGFGAEEPMLAAKSDEIPTAPPPTVSDKEELLTQDVEDAPVIDKKKESVKKEVKKVVKPLIEPTKETTTTETKVTKDPVVNKKALYTGKKTDSNSTGSEGVAGGTGNQGSVNGSTDSKVRGEGSGNGPTFSLDGRTQLSIPKPDYNYQVEGKVVVDIIVDNLGNVVRATPGARGSTTTDVNLYSAARKAAMTAKFDRKSDAPPTQKGTITYVFILN
jgi:periplasmic protein TonB